MTARDGRTYGAVLGDVLIGGFIQLYVPFLASLCVVLLAQDGGEWWVLAFIAVLPEYAVDLVFAMKGGHSFKDANFLGCPAPQGKDESPCSLALANMTGANRLLIGVGWSLVVFLAWRQWKKRGEPERGKEIVLERSHAVELAYLLMATGWSLFIALRRSITILDAVVLVTLFVAYTVRISRAPAEEPHLVGPAEWMGTFSTAKRRTAVIGLFVVAAGVILLCAEHFAEALVGSGRSLGISEFLLVQWLAPLASEAPELLVAGLYAMRLNTNAGLGTLVSSKVNQWTLLVGTLPVAFALASASKHGLPIDGHQREELFLTAAQSAFACAVLINLSMSTREALQMFVLFIVQFVATAVGPESIHGEVRIITACIYLALAARLFWKERRSIRPLLRDGFRTPYEELAKL